MLRQSPHPALAGSEAVARASQKARRFANGRTTMARCSIAAISWERVHLTLVVTVADFTGDPSALRFVIVDNEREFPVNARQIDAEQHRLEINVTNFDNRRQVPNGTWRIVPVV